MVEIEKESEAEGAFEETASMSKSQFSIYPNSVRSKRRGISACFTRIPFATLLATIMCMLGVVVFCTTMDRGANHTKVILDQVFRLNISWVNNVKIVFIILGACMGALGLMILTIGCLATGATRHAVYKARKSRVGGRISCAVFMSITYILMLAWIVMFVFLVIMAFVFSIFDKMCRNPDVRDGKQCIDLNQFYFMFPAEIRQENMKICDPKVFCKDSVQNVAPMFIFASVSTVLIILSLIHYLMCLASNYAHIRDHEKFQELQDLHYLNDPDMMMSKDRF